MLRRRDALHYAACAWTLLFAAPHLWWALGIPAGFPGGEGRYARFMASAWRYWYDVAVVGLSVLAFLLVLRLRRAPSHAGPAFRATRLAVWLGGGALTLRGLAGLVVDGRADPVWWPTFLLGGLLLCGVAWSAGTAARERPAARTT